MARRMDEILSRRAASEATILEPIEQLRQPPDCRMRLTRMGKARQCDHRHAAGEAGDGGRCFIEFDAALWRLVHDECSDGDLSAVQRIEGGQRMADRAEVAAAD